MYQSHFELHRPLFQGGDRSRHFFRSQSIREIQPRLVRTLRGSLGPSLLTARQGAGRTALLRQLRSELEHDGRAIVVSGAALDSAPSLLNLLLHATMRPSATSTTAAAVEKAELSYWSVMQQLQKSLDFWGPVFLLLDDAHLMPPGVLNELRAVSEEEWQGQSLVRILVTAPLSFELDLGRVEYAGFAQRICCHEVLEPLTVVESLELMRLEIEAAGGRAERVLTESAAALVATTSEGLPRQLSLLASETLAAAAEEQMRPADEGCVRRAVKRLQHLPLSWNLPAPVFGEDAFAESSVTTSAVFDAIETVSSQGGVFGLGVVEIGGPRDSLETLTVDSWQRSEHHWEVEPHSEVEPLPVEGLASASPADEQPVWSRLDIAVSEPVESGGGPEETRSFWDPERADFSSVVPVPERSGGPLNFGLISGDTDWYVSSPSLSSLTAAASPAVPEFRLADEEVALKRCDTETPAEVIETAQRQNVPGPAFNSEFLDEQPTEDLFRAFSGRRLKAGSGISAGSAEKSIPEGPVSLPLWRDGMLFRHPATPAERFEDPVEKRPAGNSQSAIPAAESVVTETGVDDALDAESRFATLFTRLRRLQADPNSVNAEPG